jgi:predicted acylesterase/phospholipase RssA
MGGNDFGVIPNGNTPIAVAVAASAGYPPFLAPTVIDISKLTGVEKGWRKRRSPVTRPVEVEALLEKRRGDIKALASNLSLADGGILNNVGSESCLNIDIKNAAIVSSAATTNRNVAEISGNWLSTGLKSIDLIYSAKERYILESAFKDERNEDRELIAIQLHSARVKGIITTHRTVLESINILGQGSGTEARWAKNVSDIWSQQRDIKYTKIEDNSYELLGNANIPTRLKGLKSETQEAIINAGYFKAEVSIKDTIYRNSMIFRKAREIANTNNSGNVAKLNNMTIRSLSPEWIPNFWISVPKYINLSSLE